MKRGKTNEGEHFRAAKAAKKQKQGSNSGKIFVTNGQNGRKPEKSPLKGDA